MGVLEKSWNFFKEESGNPMEPGRGHQKREGISLNMHVEFKVCT